MRSSFAALRRLGFGSLLLLCALAPARAQSFVQPTVVKTGNWPAAVYSADVNGDGFPDLIYMDQGATPGAASTTHVLLNDGKGNFTASATLATIGNSLAVGDFDGDGHVDLAWLTSDGNLGITLHVALGTGTGTFAAAASYLHGPPIQNTGVFGYLTTGKMVDGAPLCVIGEDLTNNMVYTFSLTAGPGQYFATNGSLPDGTGPMTSADLNGDGHGDLIVEGSTGRTAQIFLGTAYGLHLNLYAGQPNVPNTRFAGNGGIGSFLIRDVNLDGRPDLIAEGTNGRIDVFTGNGDGTFSSTSSGGTGTLDGLTGNGGHLIALADLNHDGQVDALTATPAGISALLGGGSAYLKLGGIYNAGPGRTSYVLADFNGDGNPDLAVDSPEGIAILYGNADGSFQTSKAYAAGKPAESLALGAFTSSGHPDAVVSTAETQAQLLLGQGDGSFVYVGSPSAPVPTTSQTGIAGLWSVVQVGDFDANGKQDIILTADGPPALIPPQTDGTFVQYGTGNGTFGSLTGVVLVPNSCLTRTFGTSAVADFTGQGVSDLVNLDPDGTEWIYVNHTPFLFTNSGPPLTGTCALHAHDHVVSGDLNGDGVADVVVQSDGRLIVELSTAGKGASTLPVFTINLANDLSVDGALTTSGQLVAPALSSTFGGISPTLGFPAFIGSMTIADLDGDGHGDLLVAYDNLSADHTAPIASAPNYLYIWYGSGGGKFLTSAKHPINPVRIQLSRNYYQVAVADVNGDGIPDLILSDGYLVSYQLGKGDGTFGAESHLLAGQGINNIASGDTRGSKNTDLVIANGGVTFSNPVANKEVLATNPDVNTGGITVLLNGTSATAVPTGTLAASPEPSVFDSAWTMTATLTGTPVPTGTVMFSIDGVAAGSGTLVNGVASVAGPLETLPGTHMLTAVYSGDGTYGTLTLTGTHTVLRGPTSIVLNPTTPYTVYYGQGIDGTFTISVVDPANYPYTGNYAVFDNGFIVPYCASLPTSVSCPYGSPNLLDAGVHSLSIQYLGDPVNAPSTSPNYVFTILPDITTAGVLTSSKNPSYQGDAVTFTIALTGNVAVPTGPVNFLDGPTRIGTGTLVGGVASFTTSALAVGTHTIQAVYTGNIDFNPVVSGTLSQTVLPLAQSVTSAITLVSSLNPSNFGQAVSFTATVTTGTAGLVPSGTVTFYDGQVSLGVVTLSPSGMAIFTTSALAVGSHSIVAAYSGSPATGTASAVLPSTSPIVVQVVNAAAVPGTPGFTLSVTPNPLSLGVGRTGILKVTITATGGFSQAVNLSCTGVPPESACMFLSPVLTGGGITTLDLTTSAPRDCGSNTPYFLGQNDVPRWPAGVVAAGLVMIGMRRKRLRGLVMLAFLGVGLSALSGCSGHCTDLGTKPGHYTFTVVATPQGGPVTGVQSEVIQLQMTIPQ